MLKKDQLTPGGRVRIRDVIKDGLIGGMRMPGASDVLDHLPLMTRPHAGLDSKEVPAKSGELLTIVNGVKRKNGITVVEVQRDNDSANYFVFWCTLRVSCDHV